MTIADLIAAHGMGFACKRAGSELYRCRITCEDRGMDFVHKSSTIPTLVEALTRIAKAARQHVNTKLPTGLSANRDMESFNHWCAVYGYDPQSAKVHQRYVVRRRRAEQLKYVIGIAAYSQLLELLSALYEQEPSGNSE